MGNGGRSAVEATQETGLVEAWSDVATLNCSVLTGHGKELPSHHGLSVFMNAAGHSEGSGGGRRKENGVGYVISSRHPLST